MSALFTMKWLELLAMQEVFFFNWIRLKIKHLPWTLVAEFKASSWHSKKKKKIIKHWEHRQPHTREEYGNGFSGGTALHCQGWWMGRLQADQITWTNTWRFINEPMVPLATGDVTGHETQALAISPWDSIYLELFTTRFPDSGNRPILWVLYGGGNPQIVINPSWRDWMDLAEPQPVNYHN